MISTPDRRVNGTINVAMTISFEEMKHFQSPYPIESLTLHYITFSLVMLTNETGVWCKILAVFAHYFLLSSFGCLSVCAWHMFKLFGPGSIASLMAATRNTHVTCWYLIYNLIKIQTSFLSIVLLSIFGRCRNVYTVTE
jgi:hypothetical protein